MNDKPIIVQVTSQHSKACIYSAYFLSGFYTHFQQPQLAHFGIIWYWLTRELTTFLPLPTIAHSNLHLISLPVMNIDDLHAFTMVLENRKQPSFGWEQGGEVGAETIEKRHSSKPKITCYKRNRNRLSLTRKAWCYHAHNSVSMVTVFKLPSMGG